ncbi:hypothetical protein CHRY9293_01746 [Chryseobacterium potabilaquae]|uniref:Uncharacterized protein n=1 Tax=Chryseobacterium potabilaquae TaxID=2675057 RepID=A0A6N4X630_9FLAO|nr:hypothetical protein CHRY9293_01746 [Chryseobacterium potabilaquae]
MELLFEFPSFYVLLQSFIISPISEIINVNLDEQRFIHKK